MKLDKRLTSYLNYYPVTFISILLLAVIVSLTVIYQAKIISGILDDVFLRDKSAEYIVPALLFFLATAFIRMSGTWTGTFLSQRFAGRIKSQIRSDLFSSVIQAGPIPNDTAAQKNPAIVISEGVEALDAYFSSYLPQVIMAALTPVLVLLFVFPSDLLSGFILLLTAPIIPVFMILIGNMADRKSQHQWKYLNRLSTHFLDALQGINTLKIFGREKDHVGEIATRSAQFRLSTMNVLKVAFLSALVLEMAAMISTAVIAVEVGLRLLYDTMEFRQAIFILILAPDFYQPMRQLGASYHSGLSGIAAADDIFGLLTSEKAKPAQDGLRPLSRTEGQIIFRDVCVMYPGRSSSALDQFNFKVNPGEHWIILGPSGSGKTTLFNLLLGFISPQSGSLLYDGVPLTEFDPGRWRSAISWIPQKPYLFHQTIADNLRFVRPEATDREILNACRKAELHDFILSLRMGYDTPVGERGTRLSAGQAQRLALARAFLREGELLLFDEPTSNLDVNLERTIWKNIREHARGKTLLIITHKLHLIQPDDHILMLVNGRTVQRGLHSQLASTEGPYRSLFLRGGWHR